MGGGDEKAEQAEQVSTGTAVAPLKVEDLPAQALHLQQRNLQLIAGAQNEIAEGLRRRKDKDGKPLGTTLGPEGATRALGTLISAGKFLSELHDKYEPRATTEKQDDKVSSEASVRALAQKLLAQNDKAQARAAATTLKPTKPAAARTYSNGGGAQ